VIPEVELMIAGVNTTILGVRFANWRQRSSMHYKISVLSNLWLILESVDGEMVSVMRSVRRAAASSPTSGIPARVVWMLVGKWLVQRMRSK
jgi:hypothetical protein